MYMYVHVHCVICVHFVLGAVYRGKYRNEHVAIKEFLTQAQAESGYDEFDDMGAQQAHQVQLYTALHVHVYVVVIQCTQ